MKTIQSPMSEKDFAWVSLTPKQIEQIGEKLLAYKKESYKKLKSILPEERTFENTIYALETSEGVYGDAMHQVGILAELSPKKEVREKAHAVIDTLSQKLVDVEYDRDVYVALCEYYEGNFADEKKSLGHDRVKLLEDTLLEYKRMGFDLDIRKRTALKKILKKSSSLAHAFRKNLNDYNDYILCTEEELDGVPQRVKESLRKDEGGLYIVSLQYPEYIPFMTYAHNRNKREELAIKNLKKGGKKNLTILHDLVKNRGDMAKLLGYVHHAAFRLETRMAKNAKTVDLFQETLLKKILGKAKEDVDAVKVFAKTLGIKKLEHYDFGYVSNKLKESLYSYNSEEVRAYFPLEHVISHMFALTEKLFSVKIRKVDYTLWHKDATLYVIEEKKGGVIGYFAFDLFPRDGKYGHAMCVDVIVGRNASFTGDAYVTPFTTVVCNFPKATKKTPSLLSIGDVETLFHEFGHCLHMTFTKVRHESQSGSNVVWDFVETPSQFMENFVWDDKMLAKLSNHYVTGKSLPKEIREKVIKAKKFQSAYFYARQLVMGMLDMDLHTHRVTDGAKRYIHLMKKYTYIELPKEAIFPAGFGHIGGGYDAGYYSYLWALVYACDAFSEFEKKGTINSEIGMRWRKEVLEKGSSEDELKLIKNFLGRAPSQKAFLKEVGVK